MKSKIWFNTEKLGISMILYIHIDCLTFSHVQHFTCIILKRGWCDTQSSNMEVEQIMSLIMTLFSLESWHRVNDHSWPATPFLKLSTTLWNAALSNTVLWVNRGQPARSTTGCFLLSTKVWSYDEWGDILDFSYKKTNKMFWHIFISIIWQLWFLFQVIAISSLEKHFCFNTVRSL